MVAFSRLCVAAGMLLFYWNYGILWSMFWLLSVCFFKLEAGSVMQKGRQTGQLDAFTLFPDLMQGLFETDPGKKGSKRAEKTVPDIWDSPVLPAKKSVTPPPPPPDLNWLYREGGEEQERVEDIPTALVLMGNGQKSEVLFSDLQALGYRVETADTVVEAFNKLKFTHFAAILMHAGFEEDLFAESALHRYLTWLPSAKRRTIFYILVGPDFHTLYDLEALALSVNLVVNDTDVKHLKPILRKSFRDHEVLFGPLLETMAACRKD